jgi:hypothetical protein
MILPERGLESRSSNLTSFKPSDHRNPVWELNMLYMFL